MASVYWLGTSSSVAQVDTFTPANVEIGDVFTLTATAEDGTTAAVSFTATAATVANVAAGLMAAWNASINPRHTPITASGGVTNVVLTADAAGVPFSVASSTTDGGGANTQTLARAATTANLGPSDWNTAANWSGGAVPVTGDTVTIDGRASSAITYGLNQSGVTLAALHVKQASGYSVGTTSAYLRISATVLKIGEPTGDGSTPSGANLIAIDTGANASTVTVFNSNGTGTSGLPTVNLKGSHASNVLNVLGGVVGVGTLLPGDTASFPSMYLQAGTLTVGSAVTAPTLVSQDGGTLYLNCAATTVKQDGGTLTTSGTGAIGSAYLGGTAYLNSTGTITLLETLPGSSVSLASNPATTGSAATITDCVRHAGSTLNVDNGRAGSFTFTNPIQYWRCGFQDATTITPRHVKGSLTNI